MQLPKRKVRVQLSIHQIAQILINNTRLEAFERSAGMKPTAIDGDVIEQLSIPLTDEEFDVIQGHFKEESDKINSEITVTKQN